MNPFIEIVLQTFCERFFSRRSLAHQVAAMLPREAEVLDVGCDDGSTALMVLEKNRSLKLQGVDVQSNRKSKIKRTIYDGRTLPFDDNSFDAVMALDVLHHTLDIAEMLKEMRRVSRSVVLLKDHASENWLENMSLCLLDYVGNAGYGIRCTYNYPSYKEWLVLFNAAGLELISLVQFGSWWYRKIQPIFLLEVHD